jgi:molybdenum cofactor biosynthesis enzyme MoaA
MIEPCLVVCDQAGNAIDVPELLMAASSNGSFCRPDADSLVPLPKAGVLFTLPSRIPVGFDPIQKKYVPVREYCGMPVTAAAAFMPPGYMQTFTSAYQEGPDCPRLPLYCFGAVGWKNGRFYAAGNRIDRQMRHEIADESLEKIDALGKKMRKKHPHNRLIGHLIDNCVFKYRCPNACNLVLGKWECPIPVSRVCNAACIGCISLQPKSAGICSSQHRLDFTPTSQEIVEYVVPHLENAQSPIASFGQGCEGEPLLEGALIEESIRGIRSHTSRGIININTNASLPAAVEQLCRAGLSSMRVSLNSAQAHYYHAYYRPKKYGFDDVVESIIIAKKHDVWVSLNYLVFPGFTDHKSEICALKKLLKQTRINMIQTRNLNIDPVWYRDSLSLSHLDSKPLGMVPWLGEIRKSLPDVRLGYFNPTYSTIAKTLKAKPV